MTCHKNIIYKNVALIKIAWELKMFNYAIQFSSLWFLFYLKSLDYFLKAKQATWMENERLDMNKMVPKNFKMKMSK